MKKITGNPTNIKEAIQCVIKALSPKDKSEIIKFPKKDLILLHMSMGMVIRNDLKLHSMETPLMNSIGFPDADGVSSDIIDGVWKELRKKSKPI